MDSTAAAIPSGVFDLVVVGAGINGAGIARDAAQRGLSVALVEKEDIGSGTSSWSGRLIHGGLRYLEQGDVALVRESLRERERLFRLAPHLVKPVPLMVPLYRHNRRSHWAIRAGMIAYDVLSFDKSTSSHRILNRAQTLARFPDIERDGLTGAAIFMDGQVVWSERLCVEVALSARADGAHVFTHARVDGLVEDGGTVRGVLYTDAITGLRHRLTARVVVNAAGPWVDQVLGPAAPRRHIGGAKGSHLVLGPFPGAPSDVVYYESRADGRLVLIIPWGGRYLIGTTDKKFEADPDTAVADDAEADYLLGEVNALVPGAHLTRDKILYTYSGVRPLPFVPDTSEWKVPRSHVVHDHAADGRARLLSIIGGKLTTYRSLAQETTDAVFAQLGKTAPRCTTATTLFLGARVADWAAYRAALKADTAASAATVDRLVDIYGARAGDVLEVGREDPALLDVLDPDSGAIGAELVFTYEHEFCRTLVDVVIRRVMVGLNATVGLDVVERAAAILAARFGWSDARVAAELADYRRYVRRFAVPGAAIPVSASVPGDAAVLSH